MSVNKQHLVHYRGQSLIEVLVALSLAVLAIGALVTVTVTSVKNAQFSRNQIQAEKYAQEGLEWVKMQKEKNSWINFAPSGSNIYCISTFPADWTLKISGSCGTSVITGTIFSREMTSVLNSDPTNPTMNVVVKINWQDSSGTHKTERETIFTNWENK